MPTDPWLALDTLGDGIYGIDRDGCCTFANRAALLVLGYDSVDDLLGKQMHELIHHTRADGSHYPRADCPLIGTVNTGRPVRLENELLWRRDGSSFLAEYSAFPILADGHSGGSVITFSDLSVRRDSRRRHALQNALSLLLNGTAEPAELLDGILAALGSGLSCAAGRLWLVTDSGLHCVATWTLPGMPPHFHLTEASEPPPVVRTAWQTAGLHSADTASGTLIASPIRTDGENFGVFEFLSPGPVEIDDELRHEMAMLGHQTGQVLGRQKTEEKLRRSETIRSAIMDTALDCIVVVDEQTRVLEFNPAAERVFGRSRESVLGQELGPLILPVDFLVGHLRKFAHYLDEGEMSAVNKHVEVQATRADGTPFPAELAVTPLKLGGEALFTAYIRDITERNRIQDDLAAARDNAEAANSAKSAFMANMSHELRTPLSAIIGYTEMLGEEVEDGADPATLGADLGKIESNARHLLGLINDVLDLSKIESGKMEVFVEEFDIAAAANDIAATVTALVDKNGNHLRLDLDPVLGTMRSDLTKLKQMLLNLLSNAAKFTEQGTVSLGARRVSGAAGDRIVFVVSDTGLGMTTEQMGKLFQRYSQAEASTSKRFGGTGLGLSISAAFASMLGGSIAVASDYGQGSRFTIELPAALKQDKP